MINKTFVECLTGAIVVLTTAFAIPAMASDGFIAQNLSKHSSGTAENWVTGGCKDSKDVQQCKNRVMIVVYGGDNSFAKASYNAAVRLDSEGIPVGWVRSRDNNDNTSDAIVATYVNVEASKAVTLDTTYLGVNDTTVGHTNIEDGVYEQGLATYIEKLAPKKHISSDE